MVKVGHTCPTYNPLFPQKLFVVGVKFQLNFYAFCASFSLTNVSTVLRISGLLAKNSFDLSRP